MNVLCSIIFKACNQVFLSFQVIINSNLEKRIIAIINEHKKQTGEKGMISRRLTAKKLQVKLETLSVH